MKTLQIITENGDIEQVEIPYKDIQDEIIAQARADGSLVYTFNAGVAW